MRHVADCELAHCPCDAYFGLAEEAECYGERGTAMTDPRGERILSVVRHEMAVGLRPFHSMTYMDMANAITDSIAKALAAHAPRGATGAETRERIRFLVNDAASIGRGYAVDTATDVIMAIVDEQLAAVTQERLTGGCSVHPPGVACQACLASAARQERERICAWLRSLDRGFARDSLYTTMAETIERDAREAAEGIGGRDE